MGVRFSANNHYLTSTTNPTTVSQTAWTALVWVRLDVVRTGQFQTFLAIQPATGGSNISGLGTASDGVTPEAWTSSSEATVPSITLTAGQWIGCGLVRSSNTLTGYFLPAGATSLTASAGLSTTATGQTRLALGNDGGSPTADWLNGTVANVKTYTAVLSTDEILRELLQYEPVRTANLQAFYPLLSLDYVDYSGNASASLTETAAGATATDGPPIPWGQQRIRVLAESGPIEVFGNVSATTTAAATVTASASSPASASSTTTASATTAAVGGYAANHATTSTATAAAQVSSPANTTAATTPTPTVTGNVASPAAATASVGPAVTATSNTNSPASAALTVHAAATVEATAPGVITGYRTVTHPTHPTVSAGVEFGPADTFNGNRFPNRGTAVVVLRNSGVDDVTATFRYRRARGAELGHPITVPAGGELTTAVWPPEVYTQADGAVWVDFTSGSGVEIAVVDCYPNW